MWFLGFEPRSPRPHRGILTIKLQPQHNNSKRRYFYKFCMLGSVGAKDSRPQHQIIVAKTKTQGILR